MCKGEGRLWVRCAPSYRPQTYYDPRSPSSRETENKLQRLAQLSLELGGMQDTGDKVPAYLGGAVLLPQVSGSLHSPSTLRLPSDIFPLPVYRPAEVVARARAELNVDEATLCRLQTLFFTSLQVRMRPHLPVEGGAGRSPQFHRIVFGPLFDLHLLTDTRKNFNTSLRPAGGFLPGRLRCCQGAAVVAAGLAVPRRPRPLGGGRPAIAAQQ